MAGFRCDDAVTVRRDSKPAGEALRFDHVDGRPRDPAERLEVVLDAGHWVSYEVELPVAGRIRVRVDSSRPAMTPAESPIVFIESKGSSEMDDRGGVEASSTAPTPAGRYSIRVTARAPGTVIRSIEVGLVT